MTVTAIHNTPSLFETWERNLFQCEDPKMRIMKDHILRDYPLPKALNANSFILDAKSIDFGSTLNKVIMIQAEKNAKLKQDINAHKVRQKLKLIGIPAHERTKVLDLIVKYIQDAPLTLNFNASDVDKIERLEKKGNLENIWSAPEGLFESRLLHKRDDVEMRMHGYDKKPVDSERPYYFGANLGNSPRGAATQYGGSYFVGKKHLNIKATYTACDSFCKKFEEDGYQVGTKRRLEGVLAGMEVDTVRRLVEMAKGEKSPVPLPGNQYIEAQVLGLKLSDIETLVLDRAEIPKGSEVESKWIQFANKHKIQVKFFDSQAWENSVQKDGIAAANSKYAPAPKGQEICVSAPTQKAVSNFRDLFGLVTISKPNLKVSLGMTAVRETLMKLSQALNAKTAPKIQFSSQFNQLIGKFQGYAQNYATIEDFTKHHKAAFTKFMNSLPSELEVKEAKNNLDLFLNLYPQMKNTKEAKRLGERFEKLKKLNGLKRKIGKLDLDALTSGPMSHTRTYPSGIEEFRKHLDKGEETQMIESAKNFYEREAEFNKNLGTLVEVLQCPEFLKHAKSPKKARTIAGIMKSIKFTNDGFLIELNKFAKNVKADPKGWMQELKV